MISSENVAAIVSVATSAGIEPEALLAVVEIESRGRPFEADGVTPTFLFEKHIFRRELKANNPGKLSQAISAGLAVSSWSKANYAGQGTSAAKLLLLQQARAIDPECANKSCSWGIGQIMGFNARGLDYASATQMVTAMSSNASGFGAQVDSMVRFIRKNGLDRHLASKNWTAFAIGYNGKGQAQNRYDSKLKAAYLKWLKQDIGRSAVTSQATISDVLRKGIGDRARVEALQRLLRDKGYPVGAIDGVFGAMTETAVFSFQSAAGLPASGIADADTLTKLNMAMPFPIDPKRANADVKTLIELGSKTVLSAQSGKTWSTVLGAIGAGGLLDSVLKANGTGLFDAVFKAGSMPDTAAKGALVTDAPAQAAVENVLPLLFKALPALLDPAGGLPIVALVVAYLMWQKYKGVAKARLDDHRQGLNQGR